MAPKTPSVDISIVTKNLKALRGALEQSLTIQLSRLQEIVDDLVSRGSLSRADADGLLNQLLTGGKDYSQGLLKSLDSVAADTRKGISAGIAPVVTPVMATAGRLADTVRNAPGMPAKPPRSPRTPAKTSTATKPTAKKASTATKPTAKKASTATKPTAKKASTAKKSTATKPTAKKASTAKKSTATKPTAKKASTAKKSTAKKSTS